MQIKKELKATVSHEDYYRSRIEQINKMLNTFADDEGFEKLCEADSIRLGCADDTVNCAFGPREWESVLSDALHRMRVVLILGEDAELESIPYYHDMLTESMGIIRANAQAVLRNEEDEFRP